MNIKDFLTSRQIDFRVYSHNETDDAQHMAHALHIPGENVAKTVLLRANGGFKHLLVLLPASEQIDMEKLSTAIGGAKVQLATESEITDCCPDCELGILPPFGSQINADTLVDESLAKHQDIFIQGDSHGETIRLRYRDFYQLEHPMVVSVVARHQSAPTALSH